MPKQQADEVAIEKRRTAVADMYVRGWSYRRIAEVVGVSAKTCHKDVQASIAEWREQRLGNIDDERSRELAKIDRVEMSAWDGWEKSQRDYREVIDEVSDDPKGRTEKSKTKKYSQAGSPQFLTVILNCIQRRCAILGIDAPVKVEDVTPPTCIEITVSNRDEAMTVAEFVANASNSRN